MACGGAGKNKQRLASNTGQRWAGRERVKGKCFFHVHPKNENFILYIQFNEIIF